MSIVMSKLILLHVYINEQEDFNKKFVTNVIEDEFKVKLNNLMKKVNYKVLSSN